MAEQTYALINETTRIVVNLLALDVSANKYIPDEGFFIVQVTPGETSEGDTYSNGKFSAPTINQAIIEQAKQMLNYSDKYNRIVSETGIPMAPEIVQWKIDLRTYLSGTKAGPLPTEPNI